MTGRRRAERRRTTRTSSRSKPRRDAEATRLNGSFCLRECAFARGPAVEGRIVRFASRSESMDQGVTGKGPSVAEWPLCDHRCMAPRHAQLSPESERRTKMRRPGQGAFALPCVLLSVSPAAAGVGVTSATEGDPTGKPPMDAERILRVGIDVVADEVITTNANDRAHLVFLDGTSLTVSPNARLKLDRYVYDPASRTGAIGVTAAQGVFRLVGGKISKSNEITIKTPSATLGLRGGISIFEVDPKQTTAQFLF